MKSPRSVGRKRLLSMLPRQRLLPTNGSGPPIIRPKKGITSLLGGALQLLPRSTPSTSSRCSQPRPTATPQASDLRQSRTAVASQVGPEIFFAAATGLDTGDVDPHEYPWTGDYISPEDQDEIMDCSLAPSWWTTTACIEWSDSAGASHLLKTPRHEHALPLSQSRISDPHVHPCSSRSPIQASKSQFPNCTRDTLCANAY